MLIGFLRPQDVKKNVEKALVNQLGQELFGGILGIY